MVTIDDYLPYKGSGKDVKLVYERQAADGGIWGPLLEKAWAKTNGYYLRTEGGSPSDAFDFLTGAPSTRYYTDPKNVDASYETVRKAYNSDHLVTCYVGGVGGPKQVNAYGLPKA